MKKTCFILAFKKRTNIWIHPICPEPRYALHTGAMLHWDFASRYSAWQTKIATNRYRFLNQLRRSKNPQANTATLLSEEIQNAKYY